MQRIRSNTDRRVVHVSLTAKGRVVEKKHRTSMRRATARIVAGLTRSEKRELERLLGKIVATVG